MCVHRGLSFPLIINGFEMKAVYSKEETKIIDDLIDRMASLYNEGKPAIVFLAGPPGSGKSTLAAVIEKRAREIRGDIRLCALGLDGFHLRQSVLMSRRIRLNGREVILKDVKGRPETFDAESFEGMIRKLKSGEEVEWPIYDRNTHDVSERGTAAQGDVFLIEGNWLLYTDEDWGRARKFADFLIALEADEAELRQRLVERKRRGGKTKTEAEKWYDEVDGPNVRLFAERRVRADITLKLENGFLCRK